MPSLALDSVIDKVISFYPRIEPNRFPDNRSASGNPCSFGLIKDDDDASIRFAACHQPVSHALNGKNAKVNQIITSYPKQSEIDVSWFDCLIRYPFKKIADKVSLEETNTGKLYVHIRDVKKIPKQVVYNFCIATRVPVEWGHYYFKEWSALGQAGVNPMLAFLLSSSRLDTSKTDPLDWVLKKRVGYGWHFPFENRSCWFKIITGEYEITRSTSCIPCNEIWGNDPTEKVTFLHNLTVRQICEKLDQPINPDPDFPKYEGETYEKVY